MNKFASLIEDKEWADILTGMTRDIQAITLSDTENKFLKNLSILQEMDLIDKGCEALDRYRELVSTEDWNEIWEKIKKFFVDLWNKFVMFIKNIPNYIRPYTSRITAINNRLGVDLNIKPGQKIMILPIQKINQLASIFTNADIKLVNGIPTLVDATGTPIRDIMKNEQFQMVAEPFDDDPSNPCNSKYRLIGNIVIEASNMMQERSATLNNSFNNFMATFTPPVGVNMDINKVIQAFKDDIIFLSNFQQKLIETAKNLSTKVQFV